MANYVILDTSIYRELGLKFNEHIDYKNLCAFTIHTDGEVLISNIVIEEFSNYYESILESKFNSYTKSKKDLIRDPYFESKEITEKEITSDIKKAKELFRKTLHNDPIHEGRISILRPTMISGLELTKFIIQSKETKESNVCMY